MRNIKQGNEITVSVLKKSHPQFFADGSFHLWESPEVHYFSRSMHNPVYCLHGAIGASDQLIPFAETLRSSLQDVRLHDFCGHGQREMPKGDFSIRLFAQDFIARLDADNVKCADVFGYSMGGYVALFAARHYPERIGRIITVASKLEWTVPIAEKEVKMLDPETIAVKVPAFAAALEKRHVSGWKEVLSKTAAMMLSLGANPSLTDDDFRTIEHEVLMCVGDRDKMVSIEETVHVYRQLRNASFCTMPSTPHPVEQLNLSFIVPATANFILKKK